MKSAPSETTAADAGDKPQASAARPRPVVAVFDLDGTLVVGQTQLLLVRFLREAGVVSRSYVAGAAVWFLAYKAGLVRATDDRRAKGAEVLAGSTAEEVESLMARFTTEVMVPRLHPAATRELSKHKAAGDSVAIVSAALEPLVEALSRHLEVTEYAAAHCELADGRYTGRLEGPIPYGAQKAQMALRLIAAHGADPAECWAYADHDTDLELLRSVGHPVAVNPRSGLRAAAEREGWPILMSPDTD